MIDRVDAGPVSASPKMNAATLAAGMAAVVFLLSLFPNAFENNWPDLFNGKSPLGTDALLLTVLVLFHLPRMDFEVYLAGFGLTNLAFPILVCLLLQSAPRFLTARLVFSLVASVYAVTWFVPFEPALRLGLAYYLWLASYGLLLLAHLFAVKERAAAQGRTTGGASRTGSGSMKPG